jgi:CDP-glycerol glycerophosphotransferase
MQPKVSVIVPVYNTDKFIGKCLDSLVRQSLAELEVIVVNDGSSDCSGDIIGFYTLNHPEKIRSFTKINGGVSDARNFGLQQASGKYVGFMDGDDWADPDMYRLLYEKAEAAEADIAVCGYYKVDTDSVRNAYLLGNMNLYGSSLKDNPELLYASAPYVWNKLYSAELMRRSSLRFPMDMAFEDICFNYAVYLWAQRIVKVNRPLYYYRLHRDGAFNTAFDEKSFAVFDSLRMVNEYYIRQGAFETFRNELLCVNLGHLNTRMKSFFYSYDRRLKRKYLMMRQEHLDRYFPGWQESEADCPGAYGAVLSGFCRHRFLVDIYALFSIPPLKFLFRSACKAVRTARALAAMPKALMAKAARFYRRAVYARNRNKGILENAALFETRHGRALGCSPFYMLKEACGEYDCYVSSQNVKKHRRLLEQNGIRAKVVRTNSARYNCLLARVKYLVNNATFPPYFTARPCQMYLNTWHGTPLKALGKEAKEGVADIGNIQRNFLMATCLLYPNRFTRDSILKDYDVEALYRGKVLIAGYPRNAVFLQPEEGQAMRQRLHLAGKRIYAYMPTWRGTSGREAEADTKKIAGFLKKIDAALGEDDLLFVKLHPLVQSGLNLGDYAHIRRFPDDVETYAFLNAADCLITDYSSVFFDFAVTGRETLLFMYDRHKYEDLQGVYLDIGALPFEKFYTADALAAHIRERKAFAPSEEYCRFIREYCAHESPFAAAEVCRYLFKGRLSAGMQLEDRSGLQYEPVEVLVMPNLAEAQDQELFLRFLSEGGENRYFAFRQSGLSQATNDILYQNRKNAKLFILTEGAPKTLPEFLALWLNRRFGFFADTARALYRREMDRNFPNVCIEKLTDYSGNPRFQEMAGLFAEPERPAPELTASLKKL